MVVEVFVFMSFTLLCEYISLRRKHHATTASQALTAMGSVRADEDTDVRQEAARIANTSAGDDGAADVLRVAGLSKVYRSRGKSKLAVDELSFGVPGGQCFGLLGMLSTKLLHVGDGLSQICRSIVSNFYFFCVVNVRLSMDQHLNVRLSKASHACITGERCFRISSPSVSISVFYICSFCSFQRI